MTNRDGPRNILILNHNRRGVGTFFRCWHLARNLAMLGFEVTLLTGSPSRRVFPSRGMEDGVHIVETPNLLTNLYAFGSGYGALGIPYRTKFALRRGFDLIQAFDHKPNVLIPAILGHRLRDLPLVADWCDWWGFAADGSGLEERRMRPIAALENTMEDYIHSEADWVTTISTGLRDRAMSLGIPPDRVTCIPSGAPADVIRPLDRASCRRELGIPDSVFLLGHVGIGERDIAMIAPALLSIRRERPEVLLGLVGPIEKPLDAIAPGLHRCIVPFGHIPFSQLSTYLGACDAFLLPLLDTVFNRTRWPNKFGDYLAAGRPVLCSNVGDVAAIVKAEGCGFVWNDISELRNAIETLVADASLSSRMGERARQLAEGRLSWQTLALEFAEVYRRVNA